MLKITPILKKLAPVLIILSLVIAFPVAGTKNQTAEPVDNSMEVTGSSSRQTDFTHTVFVEDITAVWCVYCPSASETLKSIYNSGDLDFYFICLITQDENSDPLNTEAQNRADEYKVDSYPTVEFDGGYEEVVGGQSDETNYRAAIESCSQRDVPQLEMSLVANILSDEKIKVKVTINNMESESYSGNLRVHITEIESRYDDYDGNKYPYGFLDYAINSDFNVGSNAVYETETTWDSLTSTDANGNPFGIPDPDNIMVIATVFNSENSFKTRPPFNILHYADQTAASKLTEVSDDVTPPAVKILKPQNGDTVKGSVEIQAQVTDDIGVEKVAYWIDSQTPIEMKKGSGSPDIYTATWDSTSVSDGTVTLYVEGKDQAQNIDMKSISFNVENDVADTTPPIISIQSPQNNAQLSGSVLVQAKVTDNKGLNRVDYKIDNGELISMYLTTSDIYEQTWDTTKISDGTYTLTIRAEDYSGNFITENIFVTVNNGGTPVLDTTPPVLQIMEPTSNEFLQGKVDLRVMVYDVDSGVAKVEWSIGTSEWQALTESGTNEWSGKLSTDLYTDGDYNLKFRAYDKAGNEGTALIDITIVNGFIDVNAPTVKTLVPNKGDIISNIIDITVEAKDDVNIKYVEYKIDSGDWIQMINIRNNVYQSTFDTSRYENGKHIMTIRAVDDSDNTREITLDIEISNSQDDSKPTESGLPGFVGLEAVLALLIIFTVLGTAYGKSKGRRKNK
ncbi:MAG: hypothetical protein JSV49_05660 [Thermoplasmata archaeon]|nr:MAG: hypothetical protein JSV49_05660 [Thermoplasmata archaeon]